MDASSHDRKIIIELEIQVFSGLVLFYFTDMLKSLGHVGISFEVEYRIFKREHFGKGFPLQAWTVLRFQKVLHSRSKSFSVVYKLFRKIAFCFRFSSKALLRKNKIQLSVGIYLF